MESKSRNSKTFDKKRDQLVRALEKVIEISEEMAKMQEKKGTSPMNCTARRWVGWEADSLLRPATCLNE